MKNLSSYHYLGLDHGKSVVHTLDKKCFTVVYKKAKSVTEPAESTVRRTMKVGACIIVQTEDSSY